MTLQRPHHPMPEYVKEALLKRGLMEAYRARPPYQRNDYISWITLAKLEPTRQKRLNQMLDELEGGSKYLNMEWHGK